MNKFAIAASLAAAIILPSAPSYSGTRYADPITVSQYVAYGAVRAARFSANTNEFIGCAVMGNTTSSTPTYVACSARNAAGRSFYCTKYNPSYVLIQAAMAVSEASTIIVNADSNYNCTYIYVNNSSVNL
jgi:hypothetical protein